MPFKSRLGAALIFAFAVSGYADHPVHYADAQTVALFDQAGQVHADLGYQFEKGLQTHAALAVSPHWAVHLGAAYAQQDNCFTCTKEVTRHVELGIETFRKLKDGYHQGLILGGGLGRFKTLGTDDAWDPAPEDEFVSSGKYAAVFLQAHHGKRGRIFDQAGSLRLSGFQYFDFKAWDGWEEPLAYPKRHVGFFVEPAYTLRAGYKALNLQGQIGVSLPLYQEDGLDNALVWLNTGIALNTGR